MDKALKQRLVGASVLIILAVIVLPMLLGGRSDTLQQESRQIERPPKPEELSVETRRFPVGVPNQPVMNEERQPPVPESLPIDDVAVENTVDEIPGESAHQIAEGSNTEEGGEALPTVEPEAESATLEKPPVVTSITLASSKSEDALESQENKAPVEGPRYLVQVASFSSEKNATALANRLRAEKLTVRIDEIERTAGRLHSVRVGPYAERADADAAVSKIRSQMNELSPRIVDLKPGESAPVSTPSDPLVRWVVQVGSFNSASSADALVAKLRLSGFTAFSETVTSAGNTVYKVRIGPEVNRDKVSEILQKVKTDHGLKGFVTTQE